MNLKRCVWLFGIFCCLSLTAQNQEPCGTDQWVQHILQSDSTAAQRMEQNWQRIENYIHSQAARNSNQTIITIPVVFHIIHSGQAVGTGLNISDSQIVSQMAVLNECYRKQNADTVQIPSWFKSRAADVGVEFCLASTDPQGHPTTGITRDYYPTFTDFNTEVKPYTQWDPTKYLNIWTTALTGNILGYATPPNLGPANQDGVVIDYRHLGSAPANPFPSSNNLGRTCVHEVGHWLGLFHIFQDSCSGMTPQTCSTQGDRVCDTPPEAEATYGSSPNLLQNTCHETPVDEYDMWMNYMDYVDDDWLLMFTNGQRDVMRAVLNTSRLSIQSSLGCTNTATAFSYSGKVVDAQTNQGVANAEVLFDGPQDFEATTDANGNFTISNLYEGYYDVYAGKWGYLENFYAGHLLMNSGVSAMTIPIEANHYYDDFTLNYHWTTNHTASSGLWVRDVPVGTFYQGAPANPSQDVPDDYGLKCFVTGNNAASVDADDVDNGEVTLISPPFDLTGYTDPYVRLYRWFYDGALSGNTPDDQMTIQLSNGSTTATLENINTTENTWTQKAFHVSDFLPITSTMRLIVQVSDATGGNSNIVEGAIDKFEVVEANALDVPVLNKINHMLLYPNPSTSIVNISWDNPDATVVQITAQNVLGETVLTTVSSGSRASLDFGHLPSGFYLITLHNGYSEKTLKFFKAQ